VTTQDPNDIICSIQITGDQVRIVHGMELCVTVEDGWAHIRQPGRKSARLNWEGVLDDIKAGLRKDLTEISKAQPLHEENVR
jgi:hypothetical protein